MRLSTILVLLSSAMAQAIPALSQRQAGRVNITAVNPSGSGCPPGSFSVTTSPDGSVATLVFNSYNAHVSPTDLSTHRELTCEIFMTLRYPVGCTTAVLDTTYRGFAQLQSGVTGTFAAQYVLSPGTTGANPPSTTFSSTAFGGAGKPYTKEDVVSLSERINNANQRDVSLVARTRIILITSSSALSGTLTDANATIAITQQRAC